MGWLAPHQPSAASPLGEALVGCCGYVLGLVYLGKSCFGYPRALLGLWLSHRRSACGLL